MGLGDGRNGGEESDERDGDEHGEVSDDALVRDSLLIERLSGCIAIEWRSEKLISTEWKITSIDILGECDRR